MNITPELQRDLNRLVNAAVRGEIPVLREGDVGWVDPESPDFDICKQADVFYQLKVKPTRQDIE